MFTYVYVGTLDETNCCTQFSQPTFTFLHTSLHFVNNNELLSDMFCHKTVRERWNLERTCARLED